MKTILLYAQLMRLNKPIGILLLLWPGLWALWLANHGYPGLKLLIIFVIGTILTRSAGCIINDIFDRDFDLKVERTKGRPLTSGRVSLKAAYACLLSLGILCLLLALQLNGLSFGVCLIAGIIASLYPLVKRFSHFPQLILGIAFAMPVLIAYTASLERIPANGWCLFGLAVIWPLFYDTAYALTDLKDDLKIGIKSTAVFFQNKSVRFISALQIVFFGGFLGLGLLSHLNPIFYGMLLVSGVFLVYQNYLLRHNKPFQAFLNNQWVGFALWLGIVFSLS